MSSSHTDTDVVSIAALCLAATIGRDHWQRTRPQPVQLSLQLHLTPRYLDATGRSDNVADSLHYGHLAKAVKIRVNSGAEKRYTSARALIEDVTGAAFEFVADGGEKSLVEAVRVILVLPKQILLAESFEVELTTRVSDWLGLTRTGAIVRVTNLILPVLIGVNPPERLSKQRVVTDLTFFESARCNAEAAGTIDDEVDYPGIVQQIATVVERSAHLTLEKLVYEIIQTAYRAAGAQPISRTSTSVSQIEAITVRCRKPSALSFADASEVAMTRTRESCGYLTMDESLRSGSG